jgi:hypothetical protein
MDPDLHGSALVGVPGFGSGSGSALRQEAGSRSGSALKPMQIHNTEKRYLKVAGAEEEFHFDVLHTDYRRCSSPCS